MSDLVAHTAAAGIHLWVSQVNAVSRIDHLVALSGGLLDWEPYLIQPGLAAHTACLAGERTIQQFGSIEKYTEAMKQNLEHFSEIVDHWQSQIPEEKRTDDKFLTLASHKGEAVGSEQVQHLVKEIITIGLESDSAAKIGNANNYCKTIIEIYSSDYFGKIVDAKYGEGSSAYIVEAFRFYCENSCLQ